MNFDIFEKIIRQKKYIEMCEKSLNSLKKELKETKEKKSLSLIGSEEQKKYSENISIIESLISKYKYIRNQRTIKLVSVIDKEKSKMRYYLEELKEKNGIVEEIQNMLYRLNSLHIDTIEEWFESEKNFSLNIFTVGEATVKEGENERDKFVRSVRQDGNPYPSSPVCGTLSAGTGVIIERTFGDS